MKLSTSACIFLAVVMTDHLSVAQSATATAYWEFSLDGSAWTRDSLSLPQSTSDVRVRMMGAWSGAGIGTTFGFARFDATVTSPSTASLDAVSQIAVQNNIAAMSSGAGSTVSPGGGLHFQSFIGSQRFGSVLKIDRTSDTSLPGAGTGTILAQNSVSVIGPIAATRRTDNPIVLLSFVLTLDGSVGDRMLSALFHQPGGPPTVQNVLALSDGSDVPLTQTPGTLIVIPTPPGLLALLAAAMSLARRRSR